MNKSKEKTNIHPTVGAISYRHHDIRVQEDALYITYVVGWKWQSLIVYDAWCQLMMVGEKEGPGIVFAYPHHLPPVFSSGHRITRLQLGERRDDICIDVDGQPIPNEKIHSFIFFARADDSVFVATINPVSDKDTRLQTVLVSKSARVIPTLCALFTRLCPVIIKE